jgi:hypothetical protein
VETGEDARHALLEGLIDHAPLFPPASLPLAEALAEDRRARESAATFALGRFVCPASRLDELPDVGRGVSVVLDSELAGDGRVEAVEARWPVDLAELEGVAPEIYVELPLDAALEERLDELAYRGLSAKVRCGGAVVPSVGELARLLRSCRERSLGFKATAGLHRAVARDGEHGFLNLLAAVTFGDEERALAEEDASAFALDAAGFRWGEHLAGGEELARARRERLRSIGSCSFFEPVEELEAMGILPL